MSISQFIGSVKEPVSTISIDPLAQGQAIAEKLVSGVQDARQAELQRISAMAEDISAYRSLSDTETISKNKIPIIPILIILAIGIYIWVF